MRFKGQAFETMMLVISVIVALAILGVLLNILLGFNFGVGNPTEVMKENLKQVYSKGFSSGTIAKKSTFEKGNAISAKDIIGELPLDSSDVKFNCPSGDTAICGDSKLKAGDYNADSGANQLVRVQNKVEAFIAVCGDSSKTDAPHYCIGLGSTAEKAVDACGKQGSGGCELFG
ncbi:MAG TPA: hypothetical protein VI875_03980 [Candidatus Norongarragalinales archaeon]|nr:hypothetical protein [Candidatus Norongarragalinales archaeon]